MPPVQPSQSRPRQTTGNSSIPGDTPQSQPSTPEPDGVTQPGGSPRVGIGLDPETSTQFQTLNGNLTNLNGQIDNQGAQLNQNLETVNEEASLLNQNLVGLSGEADEFNDQFVNATDVFDQRADEFNTNIEGITATGNEMNGHFANLNNIASGANNNWQQTNEALNAANNNWSATNSVAANLTNPVNLGVLIASGGAGFVVGAAVAKAAISTASMAFRFLKEKITHEKENEEIFRNFELAHQYYDKTMEAVQILENSTSQLLTFLEKFKTKGIEFSPSLAEKEINVCIERLLGQYSIKQRQLKDALDKGDPSAGKIYMELKDLKNKVLNLNKCLAGFTIIKHKDLKTLIQDQINQQLILEKKLESWRSDIAAAKGVYLKQLASEAKRTRRKNLRAINSIDKTSREIIKTATIEKNWHIHDFRVARRRSIRQYERDYREFGVSDLHLLLDQKRQALLSQQRNEQSVNRVIDSITRPALREKRRLIRILGKLDFEEQIYQDKQDHGYVWGQSKTSQKNEAEENLAETRRKTIDQKKMENKSAPLQLTNAGQTAKQKRAAIEHFFERIGNDQIAFQTNREIRDVTHGVRLLDRLNELE